MKIFISWSGIRSKEIAETLSTWIRQVIQAVDPWISLDIEKGERWNEKITMELEQTKFGIICLTSDNLASEWLLFEAGALAKTSDAHVCTFLFDLKSADIKPPLGQFQHTLYMKEDIKKLLFTINNKLKKCEEKSLVDSDLEELFNLHWPNLKSKLDKVTKIENKITRSERSILEEILREVRGLSNTQSLLDNFTKVGGLGGYIPSNFNLPGFIPNNPQQVLYNLDKSVNEILVRLNEEREIQKRKVEPDDANNS